MNDSEDDVAVVTYEEIVTETERPTLVLAGPGAGKTYLLGDRVRRLLDSGIRHDAITVLTFGRPASQNMRNKLLDPKHGFGLKHAEMPHVSTLHSLGFEIVKTKPRAVGLRKTNLRVQSERLVSGLLFRDAALREGLGDSDALDARKCKARGNCQESESKDACAVCRAYWGIMSKCNCIDYDDQVLFACQILEGDSSLLGEYQGRCQHLLVDEYQDINAAQFRLIELLSREAREGLFVVGDDAQSIYGFRGATPEFILRFGDDFENAWTPPLACSRRCHEGILGCAQSALAKLYSDWTGQQDLEYLVPRGDDPKVLHVASEKAEAQWVARIARAAVAEGKTVLVLAQKSAFFPPLSRALSQYGVPHDCPGDLLPDAVRRRLLAVWNLLEWLRDPTDDFLTRVALECVINSGIAKVPGAGKGSRCKQETIDRRVAVETEIGGLWTEVSSRRAFMTILENLRSPSKRLGAARDVLVGLRESWSDFKGVHRGEFARNLALACGGWINPEALTKDLLSVRQEITGSRPPGFSSVQLMTLRTAKGLEADVTVMVGLEDDIIPGHSADEEEQARLFYVGMTRAKHELFMIHSSRRPRDISFGKEIIDKPRSRFLDSVGIKSRWPKGGTSTV